MAQLQNKHYHQGEHCRTQKASEEISSLSNLPDLTRAIQYRYDRYESNIDLGS